MGTDDARIRAAVEATVDAGTVRFEMELETEPADVNRSRSHGVCDFTQRRAECHTVTDVPANVPDTFQITDGGVVYTQEPGGHWHALDMGGWAAASLMSDLGWFYGVVEARELAPSEHTVTTSARHAVDACPAPLRDELRTAFEQSGHLDAIATGWVRTDASNRITGCRLSIPPGGAGLFGPVDLTCRIALDLSRFGEPAAILVPDAGPAQPVREGIAQHFGRVDGQQ